MKTGIIITGSLFIILLCCQSESAIANSKIQDFKLNHIKKDSIAIQKMTFIRERENLLFADKKID